MSNIPCAFCDRSSFEHQIIAENKDFFVIHSRRPLNRGHCLIIPKEHIADGVGIRLDMGENFIAISNRALHAVTQAFDAVGVNLFANFGKVAGQEIPHAHFHVVPRYPDETISPFQKLNDPNHHNESQKIAPDLMQSEIEKLKRFFKEE